MTAREFRLIHCNECGVTSPREISELARESGKKCLVCGELLERDEQRPGRVTTATEADRSLR